MTRNAVEAIPDIELLCLSSLDDEMFFAVDDGTSLLEAEQSRPEAGRVGGNRLMSQIEAKPKILYSSSVAVTGT